MVAEVHRETALVSLGAGASPVIERNRAWLRDSRERQIRFWTERKLNLAVGQDLGRFARSVPDLDLPVVERGGDHRLVPALLVVPGVGIHQLCNLMGVRREADAEDVRDRRKEKAEPYWLYWVSPGGELAGKPFAEAQATVTNGSGRMALTAIEALFLAARLDRIFSVQHGIVALGSSWKNGHTFVVHASRSAWNGEDDTLHFVSMEREGAVAEWGAASARKH